MADKTVTYVVVDRNSMPIMLTYFRNSANFQAKSRRNALICIYFEDPNAPSGVNTRITSLSLSEPIAVEQSVSISRSDLARTISTIIQ
tara:strand:- start:305 stop:568 length:264 start_codon:yes stop_codon:yes gene_type:complete